MKKFLYTEPKTDAPIIVFAKYKPSQRTMPWPSGTWIVKEWDGKKWQTPCFPEIIWPMLKTLNYVGRIVQKKRR